MEYFKGDDLEKKYDNSAAPTLTAFSLSKDQFNTGAYESAPLGELIYDTGRSPLANAIDRDIFRLAFKQIFEAFIVAGTFESYLTVFRKIFGENVDVTFAVPAAGKLNITIVAEGVEQSYFVARRVSNNVYVNDEVVDELANNIVLQTIKGFQSQYELEQMLFEMVPAGVFTTISLTLGVA
jgi:hypothetical protein